MQEIITGLLCAIVGLIFAAHTYGLGQEDIGKQCDTIGVFEVFGVVYECKKKEVGK